jgi:cytochrome bd-type quinol oxidase subunit 2
MRKGIKAPLAAASVILLVVSALFDNETIVASALVLFLLSLTRMQTSGKPGNDEGNAARRAIFAFSLLVLLANLIVPSMLPSIAAKMDYAAVDLEMASVDGTMHSMDEREHFLEVMVNDMRELCYTTSVLLLIQLFLTLFAIGKGRKSINKDTP